MLPVSRLVAVRGNAAALRAASAPRVARASFSAGVLALAVLLALATGALAGAGLGAAQ